MSDYNYKTDVDYKKLVEIGGDFNALIEYIKTNFYCEDAKFVYPLAARAKIMRGLCKAIGLAPSNEQYVFILSTVHRLLCEACAGAGKTTMAIMRLIDNIICNRVPGLDVLAIAFNSHAVVDMKDKFLRIARIVNSTNIPNLHLDTNIRCMTFHAWCNMWVEEYKDKVSKFPMLLFKEGEETRMMSAAVRGVAKTMKKEVFISDAVVDSFMALYSYACATLSKEDPSVWKVSSVYADLKDFSDSEMLAVLHSYDRGKKLRHRMDYPDMLEYMYQIMQDPQVTERIRSNYKVMLFDEYQDDAPAMLRIIKLLTEGDPELNIPRYNDCYLTCIGDGDQSIYKFIGTDSDNCLRFRTMFNDEGKADNDVRISSMSINRRCRQNILDKAKVVIESNSERIQKPISSLKEGGEVKVFNYVSVNSEMELLIRELKKLSSDELMSSCVCYRNRSSSSHLVMSLLEESVPFNMQRGVKPFSDLYTKAIDDVLELILNPDSLIAMQNGLYKCVPKSSKLKKETLNTMFEALKTKRDKGTLQESEMHKKFFDFDWSNWESIAGFRDAMDILRRAFISARQGQQMSVYMPDVIQLVRKYYVDWLKKDKITDEYMAKVTKWYTRNIQYHDFERERKKQVKFIEDNEGAGVYLTTFHGLKGLEFDRVYVIDLDDMIFPGSELNRTSGLNADQLSSVELEARRLMYVVCTRPKDELNLFFSKSSPTRYIKYFVDDPTLTAAYAALSKQSSDSEETGFIFAEGDEPIDELPDESNLFFDEDVFRSNVGDALFGDLDKAPEEFTESRIEEESRKALKDNLGSNFESVSTKPRTQDMLEIILERSKSGEI